jgi:hypothetical protein
MTWDIKRMSLDNLKVNCYSGHTYAEQPRSFTWEGREYEVEEIERAWLEPGERHFRVRTRDNKLFRLCYNEIQKQWSLTELVKG